MRVEHPRAARYALVASVMLIKFGLRLYNQETTLDLGLFGCRVVPGNSAPVGTRVKLQISHQGAVRGSWPNVEYSTQQGDRNRRHQRWAAPPADIEQVDRRAKRGKIASRVEGKN